MLNHVQKLIQPDLPSSNGGTFGTVWMMMMMTVIRYLLQHNLLDDIQVMSTALQLDLVILCYPDLETTSLKRGDSVI